MKAYQDFQQFVWDVQEFVWAYLRATLASFWPPSALEMVLVGICLLFGVARIALHFKAHISDAMLREDVSAEKLTDYDGEDRRWLINSVIEVLGGHLTGRCAREIARELSINPFLALDVLCHLQGESYVHIGISGTTLDDARLTKKGQALYQSYLTKGDQFFMGDFINVGDNSNVVNRSHIYNSIVGISAKVGSEGEEALRELADQVIRSGDREASENFELFVGELESGAPRPGALRRFLDGVRQALPAVSESAEAISKVADLFVPQ